jgi:hypothetical protein
MEHFYKNIGEDWFDFQDLYSEIVNKFESGSHFVEVGSWKGRSSVYMAVELINHNKNIGFDCIDLWEYFDEQTDIDYSKFNNLYFEFLNNIKPVKKYITPIKMDSITASKLYDNYSIDFIFIDAAHDYKNVLNDLKHWFPKLKTSGVIAGHDYFNAEGVKMAVDEFFNNKVKTKGSCWVYEYGY